MSWGLILEENWWHAYVALILLGKMPLGIIVLA